MNAPVHTDGLRRHFDRCAAIRLSCRPADRSTAEQGIRLAYAAANLAPPKRIVWCGGPVEIASRLASASATAAIGANVKEELFESVRYRIDTFAEIFWKDILCAAMDVSAHAAAGADAIHHAVVEAANARLARLSVKARHAVLRMRGFPRVLPKSDFSEVALGPGDLAALAVYEYLRDLGWKCETRALLGLWKVEASAGWLVPYEHVCWVSERPDRLQVDTQGRLHSPDGPALRYRDGWCFWSWKGVEVPAWAIEHPERIAISALDDTLDPILRRCLIDIMTPERLVTTGAARCLSQDETGILWGMTWQHRGITVDKWSGAEVMDGTPGPNGARRRYVLPVPANLRTAREAVAWTYGMSDRQYAGLQLRT